MSTRLSILKEHITQNQQNKPNFGKVYIVALKRTPIGSYMGKLSSLKAPQLGAQCIKAALQSCKLKTNQIDQVIMGNVLSAGLGQAPARQAAIKAGLSTQTTCTTINKVCSSGLKSIIYGAQSIALNQQNVVIAGGFQSMSNAPHMILNARKGVGHGDKILVDCLTHDGLTDAFKHISMGLCAEKTALQMQISRQMQDQYCIESYERHLKASKQGLLDANIVSIKINNKGKETIVEKDEQAVRYKKEVIGKLKPAFKKQGTITSANASKINDGACCAILMSEVQIKKQNIKPLARIVAYADAEIQSVDFCKSPYYATIKALKLANLKPEDIDYFEYNEAFSVVPLAIIQMLNIPKQKVNILGGAVSMGHPIGMSGARIVESLVTTLKVKNGKYGLVGICNGGGGSSAMIIENI